MSRPPEDPENKVGVQSYLTAAAAHLKCQSALVEGPAAARAALAKHGASIPAELAQALEIVGGYATNEVSFTVTPPSLSLLSYHVHQF